MNKILVEFNHDGGYGTLCGLFITTSEKLQAIIGKDCYCGDVLGKHSEVSFVLEADHFTRLSSDSSIIEKFIETFLPVGDTLMGYNPFDYIDSDVD